MISQPKGARIGRNDACPCGSGKKYKACCAAIEAPFQTRQTPDLGDWLQRARRAVQGERFDDAEFWYRQVLSAKPNDAEALAGVGQALCWRRHRREGLRYLRQAARVLERRGAKDRDPSLLLQLASQLQHWGDIETGLHLSRLAVRWAPDSPLAHSSLALCLSRVNRSGEALPEARRTLELLPDHPGARILVAVLERQCGNLATAASELRRVIAEDREPAQTARAWLELGSVLDRRGDYPGAFTAFLEAAERHARLPATLAIDRDRVFRALASNRAGFDRALLTRWQPQEFADALPVPTFLFGFLRSGTTLTEQVLAAHPDLVVSDENDFIFELGEELTRLTGDRDDKPAALRRLSLDQARALRRLYWQRVADECGPEALAKGFIDKLALNSIDAGLIACLFPEARILFAVRDPRDICLSCLQQAFTPAPATVNLLSLEGIARQYAAVMDLWLELRGLMQPAYLELRYEDTVMAFEPTFRRVFEFLGVGWHPEVVAFHHRARGRYISTPSFEAVSRPLYQSAVARWRHYQPQLAPILPDLQPYLLAFGYPPS